MPDDQNDIDNLIDLDPISGPDLGIARNPVSGLTHQDVINEYNLSVSLPAQGATTWPWGEPIQYNLAGEAQLPQGRSRSEFCDLFTDTSGKPFSTTGAHADIMRITRYMPTQIITSQVEGKPSPLIPPNGYWTVLNTGRPGTTGHVEELLKNARAPALNDAINTDTTGLLQSILIEHYDDHFSIRYFNELVRRLDHFALYPE